MVLVGRQAPDFTAAAVKADGTIVDGYHFKEECAGQHTVVFFYPLDFTFVCPSELIALHHAIEQFKKFKVKVIAVSIDSQFTHNAWRNTPVNQGGIGQVDFDLVADVNHQICRDYGVEHPLASVALRGVFVIDRDGVVRSQTVNDLPIGRNVDEILRVVEAVQFHEEHGEVCPANWKQGKKGMTATPEGVASYLTEHADQL